MSPRVVVKSGCECACMCVFVCGWFWVIACTAIKSDLQPKSIKENGSWRKNCMEKYLWIEKEWERETEVKSSEDYNIVYRYRCTGRWSFSSFCFSSCPFLSYSFLLTLDPQTFVSQLGWTTHTADTAAVRQFALARRLTVWRTTSRLVVVESVLFSRWFSLAIVK